MSYATAQDFIKHFGQQEAIDLTDRNGAGGIDYARLDEALRSAGEVIDGYIGRRYSLPLPAPLARLTEMACDLARWSLYRNEAPPEVEQAGKAAMAWLKAVADRRVDLPGVSDQAAVAFDAPDRVFDRITLADY